jgi:hypothetical protein
LDRSELTFAIAAALVGAVLLGWILRGLFGRLNGMGPRSAALTANMASRLHTAEAAQLHAETRLAEVEADLGRRLGELQSELDAALAGLSDALAQADEVRAAYRQLMAERDR